MRSAELQDHYDLLTLQASNAWNGVSASCGFPKPLLLNNKSSAQSYNFSASGGRYTD